MRVKICQLAFGTLESDSEYTDSVCFPGDGGRVFLSPFFSKNKLQHSKVGAGDRSGKLTYPLSPFRGSDTLASLFRLYLQF